MSFYYTLPAGVLLAAWSAAAFGEEAAAFEAPVKTLGVVTITASQPTSLPTQIPTTMEGVTKEQIAETINATDSEDALKYFPSLLVRKRYIGDYNHAVLSSRASGAGNSARSAVYADGVLLSNYLGNGASYTPRWAMVTPEEIERVDVMYGPFSVAYPGNSVGAVVDYVTRMPTKLEAHAKLGYFIQPFDLYHTHERYDGHQESVSLGDRSDKFSWWLNFNHTHSHGQPLTFPTKPVSATAATSADTPVTGAVLGLDRSNTPWYLLGTATEYTTLQDHAKLKLAYDFTPAVRASYVLGYWQNASEGRPRSYLRDVAGNAIYSGNVNIDGYRYVVTATDFNLSNDDLVHVMHGLSLKSNTQGAWDWEFAASVYDYQKDQSRAATVALPAAYSGGAGTITDQHGAGWNTVAMKGVWRPQSMARAHTVDFGYQQDRYRLRILKSNILGNWISDAAGSLNTDVGGATRMHSVYAQDTWSFASKWKTVLGARVEQWQASGGHTRNSSSAINYADRNSTYGSPKAALAFQASDTIVLKASLGRAVRMPTVNELYGATSGVLTTINDPTLKPEKSWTSELSYEQDFGRVLLRATGFYEAVRDSLYSERTVVDSSVVTRIVNVGKIVTPGVELSLLGNDLFTQGLDLSGSVTYADSRIKANQGYVTIPGDTLGKYQPRVPVWRASALVNYRFNEQWTASYGVRYSGRQYSTLDNSDPNGFAYQGASRFFTTDLRVRCRFAKQWTAAAGIDNLNNYKYWNFHPYPQRTYSAELQWDY